MRVKAEPGDDAEVHREAAMTETEYDSCTSPATLLTYLAGRMSERKMRLFACCLAAQHASDDSQREEVRSWYEDIECGVDRGTPSIAARNWLATVRDRVPEAIQATILRDMVPFRPISILQECQRCSGHGLIDPDTGKGFDERVICEPCRGSGKAHPQWRTPQVVALAEAAYHERSRPCNGPECRGRGKWCDAAGDFETCGKCGGTGRLEDGTLDPVRLGILSDALEEAGLEDVVEECPDCKGAGEVRGIFSDTMWGCHRCGGNGHMPGSGKVRVPHPLFATLRTPSTCTITEQVKSTENCPQCGKGGRWRSGVGFEHEKICFACDYLTWEPGEMVEVKRVAEVPRYRGFWPIDCILGKE